MKSFLVRLSTNQRNLSLVIAAGFYTWILIQTRQDFIEFSFLHVDKLYLAALKIRLIYYAATIAIFVPAIFLLFNLLTNYRPFDQLTSYLNQPKLAKLAGGFTVLGTLILILVLSLPPFNQYFTYFSIRLALLIPWIALISWISPWFRKHGGAGRLIVYTLVVFSLYFICTQFTRITNFPFSQSWSEGNNLWIASTLFQPDKNTARIAYFPAVSPFFWGFYGLLDLVKGLPIWIHRLWWIGADTLIPFITGLFLFRSIKNGLLKICLVLWVGLFLLEVGVYVHLILISIFVIATSKSSPIMRMAAILAAGILAALTRWTWFPAVAYWGVLNDLFLFYTLRRGNWFQRLWPAALIGIAGGLPGLLFILSSQPILADFAKKGGEPLLWYRLWPNPTSPMGLLLLAFLVFGPILGFLTWLLFKKTWKLDVLQAITVGGGLAGLLAVSLTVSAKIGGGDNLHNFDMFAISLLLVAGIAVDLSKNYWAAGKPTRVWTPYNKLLLAWGVVIPCWLLGAANPILLPPESNSLKALQQLREQVQPAAVKGEVLFVTQRQLISFGFIQNVQIVPEYEKIALMEHAMAGDADYFENFYKDLSSHRFIMVVFDEFNPDLLLQGNLSTFGEENDAWIHWVVKPLLEYYTVQTTIKSPAGVFLLVPKETR